MDRAMSVEEKIKRAEEIYARRHEADNRNTTTLYLHGKEKKDIKLFKKMILQIVVCLLIYLIFYTINNNNYIFSEDFMNKTKEILSYDTNFQELYNNACNYITEFFNNKKEDDSKTQDSNGDNAGVQDENSDVDAKGQEAKTEEINNSNDENIGGGSEEQKKEEIVSNLSEEEKQILQIKNTTTFIKPVEGKISSKYGLRTPTTSTVPKNHTGTDIAANLGTKIISSTDGEVVIASSEGDYGIHLKIQIGEVSVIYAHCNKLYVKQGDIVHQGQEIAEVGSTGNSTGPHLHFEIRVNEKTIDPEKIMELQ